MEFALVFLLAQITPPAPPIDERCRPLCFGYTVPEPGYFAGAGAWAHQN